MNFSLGFLHILFYLLGRMQEPRLVNQLVNLLAFQLIVKQEISTGYIPQIIHLVMLVSMIKIKAFT